VTVSDAKATYVSSASVNLTATDAGSGVAGTYYRLDGAAQVAGTTIATSAIGSHTIEFWSVDVAGNTETHKTAAFAISAPPAPVDATAPVTVSDAKATYVSSASVKLTATDAGSGVAGTYFRLDGGAQTAGTTIATSAIGSHTIEFWSVDVAGNTEAHKSASFAITAPPVPNPDPSGVDTSTLTIRANDDSVRLGRGISLSGSLAPSVGGDQVAVYVRLPRSTQWVLASSVLTQVRTYSGSDSDERDSRYATAYDLDDDDDRVEAPSTAPSVSNWSVRYVPRARGTYYFQVRFAGDTDSSAATSRNVRVYVR
jgi:hypothetical protein